MPKKKTKEEFIKDARKVHGGKYDYSKVEYVNNHTKVCIICPKHGEFWQRPSEHNRGVGCSKCSGKHVPTTEEWIASARKVHGDKYDYSKVNYVNNKTNVCIICPEHGEFLQNPKNHLKGNGCPKCANEATGERRRLSKSEFIKKSREVHGDKYDYSKVEYIDNKTKVCIICPEHGEFWQRPHDHLNGRGCRTCEIEKRTLTKEEFIKKAKELHGDKYDYSKVTYVGAHTKIRIICHEHGEFWQRPNDHTKGAGCPKCNLSHLERSMMNYLDEHEIAYDYQKRFKWFGRQSLDFYLPEYKVGIECQGKQHFFPVERFGGDKGFKQTLERDKRKKALCEKHGVKLLYYSNLSIKYPYDVFEDLDLLFKEIKN